VQEESIQKTPKIISQAEFIGQLALRAAALATGYWHRNHSFAVSVSQIEAAPALDRIRRANDAQNAYAMLLRAAAKHASEFAAPPNGR